MINLKLNALKPDMVVSKPVYDFQDVLILNAGTVLTEKNIMILKSWGVTEVWVQGRNSERGNRKIGSVKKIREYTEKRLIKKFSEVLNDSIMEEIMIAASKQLFKRYLREENK
jgi:hypothetical protein